MTPELIELYRKVQGRRGEWRIGDGGLEKKYGAFTVTRAKQYGMEVVWDGGPDAGLLDYDDPDLLWLPPVWSKDGRCLWAWVDWEKWDFVIHDDGLVNLFGEPTSQNATLPEALLRAIVEQEGV